MEKCIAVSGAGLGQALGRRLRSVADTIRILVDLPDDLNVPQFVLAARHS